VDPAVVAKLCKILRLVNSPNAGEAASARLRVQEIKAQHGITDADLRNCVGYVHH
jgi:hypothetical protein